MRILMVTDFYWPYLGGVEQHVRHLSHSLAARGHSVSVATLGGGDLPRFELDGKVRVYRIETGVGRMKGLHTIPHRPWAPPFPDRQATRELMEIINRVRPNILHGHDWLARSALPLKKRSEARFVMSLHYYTLSCAKKSLFYRGGPCTGPGPSRRPRPRSTSGRPSCSASRSPWSRS